MEFSKRLLQIQCIAMFAALLPSFLGVIFSNTSVATSEMILWFKSASGFIMPLFIYTVFLSFSFVAGFFNLGKKSESPLLWTLITEILDIVWIIVTIILLSIVFGDPDYMEYTDTFADAFIAIFGVLVQIVLIFVIGAIGLLVPAIHGITYTIRCLRVGIFKKETLPIVGLVFMFLLPVVGSIILSVYESELKKRIGSYEDY